MKKLHVLLVEDQTLMRGALAALLQLDTGIEKVLVANDAQQALHILSEKSIDVLITDIEMPGISGIDLCNQAVALYPELKRIIITTFRRVGYVRRAIEAKVDGFFLKDTPADDLVRYIYDIWDGKRVIDPELLLDAMDFEDPLSDKERAALRLANQGKSNKEIAEALFLSLGTVKNYMSSSMAKLGASNRIEAIRIANKKGLL